MLLRYFRYLLKARDEHSVHSPFVFGLYTDIIRSRAPFYVFEEIELRRQALLKNTQSIEVMDLGAGSRRGKNQQRRIKDIARHAEKNSRYGQLLFRLVNHFQPDIIFDLGTSLGITTLYLAAASRQARVYTFEGCPATARIARENFTSVGYQNIELVEGNLDDTLARRVAEVSKIDFAFFDANHRYEPTLRYFRACLSKAHEQSVFIFDDIYWSPEMEKAWQEIKNHPKVMLTIDLFQFGLVFFRTNQPKQHFTLRF